MRVHCTTPPTWGARTTSRSSILLLLLLLMLLFLFLLRLLLLILLHLPLLPLMLLLLLLQFILLLLLLLLLMLPLLGQLLLHIADAPGLEPGTLRMRGGKRVRSATPPTWGGARTPSQFSPTSQSPFALGSRYGGFFRWE